MEKFILTEDIKHILNEKYLLDERYILVEAFKYDELTAAVQDIRVYVQDQINNITNDKDSGGQKQALKQVLNRTQTLIQNTEKVNDAMIIRGKIDEYFTSVDGFLKTYQTDFNYTTAAKSDLEKIFKQLHDLNGGDDDTREAAKNLKKALATLSTAINNTISSIGSTASGEEGKSYSANDKKVILTQLYRNLLRLSKENLTADVWDKLGKDDPTFQTKLSDSLTELQKLKAAGDLAGFLNEAKKYALLGKDNGEFNKVLQNSDLLSANEKNVEDTLQNDMNNGVD